MRDSYIPQNLDQPERYIIFTLDELLTAVGAIVTCTVLENFAVGLLMAAVLIWTIRKVKQGSSLQRVLWALYWLLPPNAFPLKATPPSYLRQFAG